MSIVFLARAMDLRADSLFGSYPRYPPVQFAPMDATENPSHGGEAHMMSARYGNSIGSRTLPVKEASNTGSLSTVNVSCPAAPMIFEKDFVPQNSSTVFIERIWISRTAYNYRIDRTPQHSIPSEGRRTRESCQSDSCILLKLGNGCEGLLSRFIESPYAM